MQISDDVVRVAADVIEHKLFGEPADDLFDVASAALTAALAAMWRPIEEAPRDRTRVLLYTEELSPPTIQAEWRPYDDLPECGEWVDVWNNDPIEAGTGAIRPTAWQPLPSPPSTNKEEGK